MNGIYRLAYSRFLHLLPAASPLNPRNGNASSGDEAALQPPHARLPLTMMTLVTTGLLWASLPAAALASCPPSQNPASPACQGSNGSNGAAGGAGVTLSSSTYTNKGSITGGKGGNGSGGVSSGSNGGNGGAGISVSANGLTLTNSGGGTITGGKGGKGGGGGFSGAAGGAGGAAVSGNGFTLTNNGSLKGGNGGGGAGGGLSGGAGGAAGNGVSGRGFTLTNSSSGTIKGGKGGNGSGGGGSGGNGGGGSGVSGNSFTLTNSGTITGGSGGAGGAGGGQGGNGGTAGNGVSGNHFTLMNRHSGTITGGNNNEGGAGGGLGGNNGASAAGVASSGNSSITTAGHIGGGSNSPDAVELSGSGNTLTLEKGFSFTGYAVSNSGNNNGGDTLALGGSDNADFDINQVDQVGSGKQYQGFAHYQKTGTSTWTLIGSSTVNMPWEIIAGTLQVGNSSHPHTSLTSHVDIQPNGTLGGYGTIKGNVSNAGTLTLNRNLGMQLTISGNYTQQAGATLNTEVSPDTTPGSGYSQLVIGGKANLDGKLAVKVNPGHYLTGSQYQLIDAAGGVNGHFSAVMYNPAFANYLTPVVNYNANNVTLSLRPKAAAYSTNEPNYRSAVNIWAGQAFGSVLGRPFPMPEGRKGAWVQYIGSRGNLGQGSHYIINGGAAGVGLSVTNHLVLGVAAAGGTANTTQDAARVRARTVGGFLYGIWRRGGWRLAGSVGAGRLNQNSRRVLSGLNATEEASSHGHYVGVAVRTDYTITLNKVALSPYAGVGMMDAHHGAAQEHGMPLLAINYSKARQQVSHYQAGLRVAARGNSWQPWLQAGVEGWGNDRAITVTEHLGAYSKKVTSSALPSSALSTGAGVNWHAGNWDTGLAWHGAWHNRYRSNSGTLQVRYSW